LENKYLGKIGTNEGLLKTRPQCQRDDQELIGVFYVLYCVQQKTQWAFGLLLGLQTYLFVSVQEEKYASSANQRQADINSAQDVNRLEQGFLDLSIRATRTIVDTAISYVVGDCVVIVTNRFQHRRAYYVSPNATFTHFVEFSEKLTTSCVSFEVT
jgi:hypothetical protein